LFVGVSLGVPRPAEVIPARAVFAEFPLQFAGWSGRRESLEAVYSDALQLDDYLLVDFVSDTGEPANLYISWYNSQRKGEAVHSPRSCLPGGGWQMREFGQRELPGVVMNGKPLSVNRSVVELGNSRELVYYWFDQRGRDVTNEVAVKWYIFWDALTRHRTDGAMIRLITAIPTDGDTAAADRRLNALAAQIAPQLPRFVPN
jgi:EpsI family protein